MKYYLENTEAVLQEVGSGENGLSQAEADRRLAEFGKNKLAEKKKDSFIKRFFAQLADPMIILLLVAAVISGVIAVAEGETLADVFIILFVVIMNAVLGVVQESKAEQAIEALKEMSAATSKVIRDGMIKIVKSEDLVKGDVIVIEAGDSIPADARIIESASLKIEEAALTGESVPAEKTAATLKASGKDVPLGDRTNMMYMGSTAVYGRGKAVIVETAMQTEVGKIADAIAQAEDGETPLQKQLGALGKFLTYIVIGICVFIFAFSLIRNGDFSFAAMIDTFMVAVSLAVAAIPEGLTAVVTIVLSIGVTKMSKRNAIIRKLTAVETLGCTQIICSDKTGTLTQNKMTVVDYFSEDQKLLAEAMSLCTDVQEESDGTCVGDPTEVALVNYADELGMKRSDLAAANPRVTEAPFDSMRKMMSTVHKKADGSIVQYTKGATDELLKRCTKAISGGQVVPMTEEIKKTIMDKNFEMASRALRVLAAASRNYDEVPQDSSPEALEQDLCFIGLEGMIDPVRPEVIDAVRECKNAGIRVVMITGDHIDTAVAIAKEIGIIEDASQAITGAMLNDISEEQLAQDITKYSVYARVQPEHKVRIVTAWKAQDCITAMTGDGVNDAPSIKSADIGIGMGITGTDVTKNVADMVLADDNFATIVSAVEEGRKIYDNIRNSVLFLLSSNLAEVLAIFVASLLNFTVLESIHLLWINLITDCFPALALGMEQSDIGIMSRPPRDSKAGIFSGGAWIDTFIHGFFVMCITLGAYITGVYIETGSWQFVNHQNGMTMAFLAMSLAEIFHSFNMRSRVHSIFQLKHHNKWLYGAMILSLVLTTAVIYIPGLSDLFRFAHINFLEYALSIIYALMMIPLVECTKFIRRKITHEK